MIGGKIFGDKLEPVLNEHAAHGWRLKAITWRTSKAAWGPAASRVC